MTFSTSAKIKEGSPNLEKSQVFRGSAGVVFARKCSFSYSLQDKQHFPFPLKFKMAAEIRKI